MAREDITDETLEAALAGDREALDEVGRRLEKLALSFAWQRIRAEGRQEHGLTHDDQEAVQDGLLYVWERFRGGAYDRSKGRFITWAGAQVKGTMSKTYAGRGQAVRVPDRTMARYWQTMEEARWLLEEEGPSWAGWDLHTLARSLAPEHEMTEETWLLAHEASRAPIEWSEDTEKAHVGRRTQGRRVWKSPGYGPTAQDAEAKDLTARQARQARGPGV